MNSRMSERRFIGSIDQGTTSTRFIIFDTLGAIFCKHQKSVLQVRPHPGWEEHDPMDILASVIECIERALHEFTEKGFKKDQIISIGVTNQRGIPILFTYDNMLETTCVWDTVTGLPLYNAIVWLDTRTIDIATELNQKARDLGIDPVALSGLPISTYFSAVKLAWMFKNVGKVKEARDNNRLAFGTVDSWLVYKLTGGKHHVTDVTNASRTLLMNIRTLQWDSELLRLFDIPENCLAKIIPSAQDTGIVCDETCLLHGLKITGIVGDQQSAMLGHKAVHPGSCKNTYGLSFPLIKEELDVSVYFILERHPFFQNTGC